MEKNISLTKNKNNKNSRIIILVDDSVDKDLQSILRPLNLMLNILLYPKYCIKNNFIKPNSLLCTSVSFCTAVCISFVYVYRWRQYYANDDIRKYFNIIYTSSLIDIGFYSFGFTAKAFMNIYHAKYNIKFVLSLQKVHRFLNSTKQSRTFIIGNWLWLVFIFSMYCVFIYIPITFFLEIPIYSWITDMFLIYFDVNMIYTIRLIQLLKDKVKLWNEEIMSKVVSKNVSCKTFCRNMFDAYANILECYHIYEITSTRLVIKFIIN